MHRLCQTLLVLLTLTMPAIPTLAADSGPGKPYLAAEPLGGQHDGTTLGGGIEADLGTASADPAPADNAPDLNDTQATDPNDQSDPNDLDSSRSTTLATVMLTLIAAGIAAGMFVMHKFSHS
ncbi:MAG TPA: hypothetical protein V6D23_01165 [Candidatus Obscuribacterales bacterium]